MRSITLNVRFALVSAFCTVHRNLRRNQKTVGFDVTALLPNVNAEESPSFHKLDCGELEEAKLRFCYKWRLEV